jgi:molecular chaperone DnaK (HSP70)
LRIGIDLGSSSTIAAFVGVEGLPIIIPDAGDLKQQTTPSRILLQGNRALIGAYADRLGLENPDATVIANFKRHFGTSQALAHVGKQPVHSEVAAALLLKKVRNDAEVYIGEPVDGCVITVPAHYHDQQRRSILSAAELAGLNVLALLDEPIAAALSYTRDGGSTDGDIIVIYDIGGGTFDLSVLTCTDGQIHILAKSGLTDLGGFDFDRIIEERFRTDFVARFGSKSRPGPLNDQRIAALAEQVKIELSGAGETWPSKDIYLDGRFLHWAFDPDEYAERAGGLIKRTEGIVLRTLRGIGLELDDINRFVLVGGASRGQAVRAFWQARIDPARQNLVEDQPLYNVAKGAALYADSFADGSGGGAFVSNMKLSSVTGYNIGIRRAGGQQFERLIQKNAALPASGSAIIRLNGSEAKALEFDVCQYLETPDQLDPIGRILVEPVHFLGREKIEIIIKNKEDGSLGIKVLDPQSGGNLPFAFRDLTGGGRDLEAQRQLLAQLRVNTLES